MYATDESRHDAVFIWLDLYRRLYDGFDHAHTRTAHSCTSLRPTFHELRIGIVAGISCDISRDHTCRSTLRVTNERVRCAIGDVLNLHAHNFPRVGFMIAEDSAQIYPLAL